MKPERIWFREHERSVHQTDRIIQAVIPCQDALNLYASLNDARDFCRRTNDNRRLIRLTAYDRKRHLRDQSAYNYDNRCSYFHADFHSRTEWDRLSGNESTA